MVILMMLLNGIDCAGEDKVDDEVYRELTEGWNKIVEKRKTFSICSFFKKTVCKPTESAPVAKEVVEEKKAEEDDLEVLESAASEGDSDAVGVLDKIVEVEPHCPAQEKLIDEIAIKKYSTNYGFY